MKLGSCVALTAGAITLAFVACSYPEFVFDGGGGGSAASGTGGGNGGGGLTTTGTGTPTGTTGTGTGTETGTGAGTPAGSALRCTHLGMQAECDTGQKCTIVNPANGTLGCINAGATPEFAACTSNEQCGAAAWCDEPSGVCKPICDDVATCRNTYGLAEGTVCSVTKQGGQTVLGGLKVCSAHCNPGNGVPCKQDGGAVNCAFGVELQEWDCMSSGNVDTDGECSHTRDCRPWLACGPDGVCRPWCSSVGDCCSSCKIYCFCQPCDNLSSPVSYGGSSIGACRASESKWCCL